MESIDNQKRKKTAQEMWNEHKEELKSGVISLETLKDLKDNLISSDIEFFTDLVHNGEMSKDAIFKLTEGLIKLEPPHSTHSPIIRQNILARALFMYDNPVIDEKTRDQFISYDPNVIRNLSQYVTDDQIKFLIAGGVKEEDIASVAFFNTIGSAFGNPLMSKAATISMDGPNRHEREILITMSNLFKGEAKITRPPQEILKERIDIIINGHPNEPKNAKTGIANDKSLSKSKRNAKIKEIREAEKEALEFMNLLKGNITEEHKKIVQRYKQLNTEIKEIKKDTTVVDSTMTSDLKSTQSPPEQKNDSEVKIDTTLKNKQTNPSPIISVPKKSQHEINLQLLKYIEDNMNKLYSKITAPNSIIKKSEYQAHTRSLMDNISELQLKTRIDETNKTISASEKKEIDQQIQDLKGMLAITARAYKPTKQENLSSSNKFEKFVKHKVSSVKELVTNAQKSIEQHFNSNKSKPITTDEVKQKDNTPTSTPKFKGR